MKEIKKKNFEENAKFVRLYVKYLQSKSNKEWSREQQKFIDSIYRTLPRRIKVTSKVKR